MNKVVQFMKSDFPRAPALFFCAWILFLVMRDLLAALGFISDASDPQEKSEQETVSHFVQFQTIELKDFSIMVGTQYQANDGSAPEKQWCYVSKISSEGSHRINITLAEKAGTQAAIYQNISQTSARKIGLPANSLQKLAQTHCNFL